MKVRAGSPHLYRGEQNSNHTAIACLRMEGAECCELHTLGEADDLCHGANVAPAAASLPTMIDGAFQGEA